MPRRPLHALAAALAVMPQVAAAQAPLSCVPSAQVRDVVLVALPGLIKGAGLRCAATLPVGAPLGSGAPGYAAQFQAASDRAWPSARGLIEQLVADKLPTFLDEATFRVVLDQLVGAAAGTQLDPQGCRTANRIATAIQPLPSGNVADLTAVLIEMAAREKKLALPIPICPAPGARP